MISPLRLPFILAVVGLAAFAGCRNKENRDQGADAPSKTGIELSDPCAFPGKAGEPVGVTYINITNHGPEDDRLVSIQADVAARVETHQSREVDGVMQMVHLEDGFDLPAGQTLVMEPGSYHLMLMNMKADLVEGQSFPMVLTFEKSGPQTVRVPVSFDLR